MFTNLHRVFNFAITDFSRNSVRAISAIFVLVITIGLVTGLFYLHGISSHIILQVQNKIDVAAYFKQDVSEESILNAKEKLLQQDSDIESIEYVSKEQALANFTERHKDEPAFANALAQLGDNPFLPSLNIITSGDTLGYQKIAMLLQEEEFSSLIDKVDYSDKKDTIEKIFSISSAINRFGAALAVILVIIAVLIVFNTIKLAIDGSKEEIDTMRTVGASSWFIRAPFIIQGALFGCISFVICFIITLAFSYFLSSKLLIPLAGFNVFSYFVSSFWIIVLLQLGGGILLGVTASFVVVQKYLKV